MVEKWILKSRMSIIVETEVLCCMTGNTGVGCDELISLCLNRGLALANTRTYFSRYLVVMYASVWNRTSHQSCTHMRVFY